MKDKKIENQLKKKQEFQKKFSKIDKINEKAIYIKKQYDKEF